LHGLLLLLVGLPAYETGFAPTVPSGRQVVAPQSSVAMQIGNKRVNRRKRGAQIEERRRELDRVRLENPGSMLRSRRPGERTVNLPPFRYLCVLDVEATCERNSKNYVHEIIEFPVVVVDLHENVVVGEFHTYVRPTVNATLSAFCTQLTGITQERIENAPTLDQVLESFEAWRVEQKLVHSPGFVGPEDFAFAADGPWDLRFFLHAECVRKGIPKQPYFDKWVNIKTLFADFYRTRSCKIHKMLEIQNMRFEGRLHSGIDDTRNIARIAVRMAEDGCSFYLNEALSPKDRALSNGGTLFPSL